MALKRPLSTILMTIEKCYSHFTSTNTLSMVQRHSYCYTRQASTSTNLQLSSPIKCRSSNQIDTRILTSSVLNHLVRNHSHLSCKMCSTRCDILVNVMSNLGTIMNVRHTSSQGKHPFPKVPPSKIMKHYDIHGSITNEDSAKQFIYALKSDERKLLLSELEKYRDVGAIQTDAAKPSRQQLQLVFLHQALPFIGFGFLDNLLMIIAGEYIDATLGAAFGISTMAAAALGNLISDVGGIGSASYIESMVSRMGVRAPQLGPEQVDMSSTKWSSNMGKVVGITIGCLLGMFPLLFFDDKDDEKTSKDKEASETDDNKNLSKK